MMVQLMNSAVMTSPGTYKLRMLTLDEFVAKVKEAYAANQIVNHLGYQQNIDLIYEYTGIRFPLRTDRTDHRDGDISLAMRLTYRIADPNSKWKHQKPDYEFLEFTFVAEPSAQK